MPGGNGKLLRRFWLENLITWRAICGWEDNTDTIMNLLIA
jgi:hypothetical protein